MSVLNIMVMVIGAILVPVLMAFPLIIGVKGWGAWQALPREVYNRHRQQVFHIQPIYFWIAFAILGQISTVFEWLHWLNLHRIAEAASTAILAIVLVYHFRWAFGIVRSGLVMDARLQRFARYALWSSVVGILLAAAGFAGDVKRLF